VEAPAPAATSANAHAAASLAWAALQAFASLKDQRPRPQNNWLTEDGSRKYTNQQLARIAQ
jgi:hypothetical protein